MRDILLQSMDGDGGVDLHAHTTFSDGHWEPEHLVHDAAALNIRVLAVTDHDTVAGLARVRAAADLESIAFIPGLEVTLSHRERPYHLLCYDVDPEAAVWSDVESRRRLGQQRYYRRLLELIREAGYAVRDEDVLQEGGEYRQHAATGALRAAGYANSYAAAQRLLQSLHIKYPFELLSIDSYYLAERMEPGDALCVIAHAAREETGVCAPATSRDLGELKEVLPLVGLETYHPYHSEADVAHCLDLCAEHRLSPTAGSDAHGAIVNRPLHAHSADLSRQVLEMISERWT
jgi:predicted metal-dependent phosphoesterase TrpH